MKETNNEKIRYEWVDNVKFAACMLVVLGHFFMGMAESEIIRQTAFYNIVNQAVYTFHVPVFFVCSGFLYQKSDKVHTLKAYSGNALSKLLNLGVPYLTFTAATILLKTVFSGNVNNQATDLVQTLFIEPVAPYWYLYALLLFFLLVPCLKSKKQAWLLFGISIAFRIIYTVFNITQTATPYFVRSVTGRLIWFALGILLAFYEEQSFDKKKRRIALIICPFLLVIPSVLSVIYFRSFNGSALVQFVIGMPLVLLVVFLALSFQPKRLSKISSRFSEYFMPVYVMHTIFAAGVRIVLLKFGIDNIFIHIAAGLVASLAFPIAIYEAAKRLPPLLFFIYPKKAISKIKGKKK